MIRKTISVLLGAVLVASFAGCQSGGASSEAASGSQAVSGDTIKICVLSSFR